MPPSKFLLRSYFLQAPQSPSHLILHAYRYYNRPNPPNCASAIQQGAQRHSMATGTTTSPQAATVVSVITPPSLQSNTSFQPSPLRLNRSDHSCDSCNGRGCGVFHPDFIKKLIGSLWRDIIRFCTASSTVSVSITDPGQERSSTSQAI